MQSLHVRRMAAQELPHFYAMIKRDFAADEYPPFSILLGQLTDGIQQGLVLQDSGEDIAYAMVSNSNENNSLLISLLAVMPTQRGKGVGTAFIKAIAAMHSDYDALLLEVERPMDAKVPTEVQKRKKRIAFYQRAGLHLIPTIGFYSIWNVPMHLMALPLNQSADDINATIEETMRQLYKPLLGERGMHRLKIQISGTNA